MGIFPTKKERLNKKLFKAIEKRHFNDIAILLKQGADANCTRHAWGQSALILASSTSGDNFGIIQMLLNAGAEINYKTTQGNDALQWATARRKSLEEVELLVSRGANVKSQSNDGASPLHFAAGNLDRDHVTFLIDAGADPALKDKNYSTPSDYARKKSYGFSRFMDDYVAAKNASKTQEAVIEKCEWTLSADDEIARVVVREKLGYAITELFNFSSRTYTKISRNISTNAESQSTRFFEEFPDQTPLENAYGELLKQGGEAPPPQKQNTGIDKATYPGLSR